MSGRAFRIVRAGIGDVDRVVPLFEAYRRFYRRAPDPDGSRRFIRERIAAGDAVVFVALEGDNAIGFVQLYPTYTSVDIGRIWLLNDLYVIEAARRLGVARALLERSIELARDSGALRLQLETAADNASARGLYESAGWVQIAGSCFYDLWLNR